MDDIKERNASLKGNLAYFLNNSDTEEITLNRFEKADSILTTMLWQKKDAVLQDENRELSQTIIKNYARKYRCNSPVQTTLPDLVYYERNIPLLAKIRSLVLLFNSIPKQKALENLQLLMDECNVLYDKTLEISHVSIRISQVNPL
jgi:hypothetical protein